MILAILRRKQRRGAVTLGCASSSLPGARPHSPSAPARRPLSPKQHASRPRQIKLSALRATRAAARRQHDQPGPPSLACCFGSGATGRVYAEARGVGYRSPSLFQPWFIPRPDTGLGSAGSADALCATLRAGLDVSSAGLQNRRRRSQLSRATPKNGVSTK
jgi:hypothetical protein